MAEGKRKRREIHAGRPRGATIKTDNGSGPKSPQTPLALIMMGKGLYRSYKPSGRPGDNYRGPSGTGVIFDPVQAKINRDAGLCG